VILSTPLTGGGTGILSSHARRACHGSRDTLRAWSQGWQGRSRGTDQPPPPGGAPIWRPAPRALLRGACFWRLRPGRPGSPANPANPAWSGWASSVTHGPRLGSDHEPRYEPGRHLRHRAAGPSGQCPPVLIHVDGHRGPAPACSRSNEPTAVWLRTGLGRQQPTYHRTERPGPQHPPGPARARSPWLGTG
jgi:hypothetical protein